jgi:hypothetical protein
MLPLLISSVDEIKDVARWLTRSEHDDYPITRARF